VNIPGFTAEVCLQRGTGLYRLGYGNFSNESGRARVVPSLPSRQDVCEAVGHACLVGAGAIYCSIFSHYCVPDDVWA
jgi:hypothetical protein